MCPIATKTESNGSMETVCLSLLEENPAFGAAVIGSRETGVGLNLVLGKDIVDMLTHVGSAAANKGQDGRSRAAQAYSQ